MLRELYEYALSHDLAARPGFRPKRVKCHLMLSKNGQFLGIDPCTADTVYCPDIGSAANGTAKCNVLVEKACIPLNLIQDPDKDKNVPVKHRFFLTALESGEEAEPLFAVVRLALEDPEIRSRMAQTLSQGKYKPADVIGFSVDGIALEESPNYLDWWNAFRKQFAPPAAEVLPRCLITGEALPAMETVPKVSGLIGVGGHTAGDAFLCFDKPAFQSYGLEKSYNAPVSEAAMTAVNAALTDLIARADTFGGAKLVHWYSGQKEEPADLISIMMGEFSWDSPEPEAADDGQEREALSVAQRLVRSIDAGESPPHLNARYYILPLSGASGRMMVRGWYEGEYTKLWQSIRHWFEDLRLVGPKGVGRTRPPKLKALCVRLLKPGDTSKVFDRMDKELSNLLGRLFYDIVEDKPLPDEVARRALIWLRSNLLRSDKDDMSRQSGPETLVYQLLKAWLRRRQKTREGVELMTEALQSDREEVAYQCGRLMAVYAKIQAEAYDRELNAGVLQRYYAAASTSPKLVLGKLAQLSQHHLSKIDNKGTAIRYEKMLDEIVSHIPHGGIPSSLNLEQQTEFALGYYHQRAEIFAPSSKQTALDKTDNMKEAP